MKFKSGLEISGSSNLGGALALSLLLHGVLMWQVSPVALAPKRFVSPQANFINASFSPLLVPEAPSVSADSYARSKVKSEKNLPSATAAVMPNAPPRPKISHAAHPSESSGGAPAGLGDSAPGESGSGLPWPAVLSGEIAPLSLEEGIDANGLRQYRLGLAAAARRFKRYPPQAQENGWSGTAEVRVAIAANGAPQPPVLLRSSGHQLLDAAALEMIGNAALGAIVPASLRGQSFSVPLPVVFSLNGE